MTPFVLHGAQECARRLLYRFLSTRVIARRKVIVGLNEMGVELAREIAEDPCRGVVSGFFDDRSDGRVRPAAHRVLGSVDEVARYVKQHGIHVVYITLPMTRDPRTVFLWVELTVGEELVAANRRFFVPMKDALLPRPKLDVQVIGDAGPAGNLRVRVASDVLARAVRLAFDAGEGAFSDNYFDLLPGRPVEVEYRPAGPLTAEALRGGLSVVSLTDAAGAPEAAPAAKP